MKKLITGILFAILATFSSNADVTNVGIKFSAANLDASGSHDTNLSGTTTSEANDADFSLASFFVERQVEASGNLDMALGIDVIPFEAEVDKIGGGTGFDATINVSNFLTAYIQPTFNPGGDVSFFVRAGYSMADLDIEEISRQATTAGTASTDGAQSKTLEGPMFGIGVQSNTDMGFVRIEGTITDFDEISHTNSNGKVLKADAEMTLISISVGKSF